MDNKTDRHTIVEIGPGACSIIELEDRFSKDIESNSGESYNYIAIDCDLEALAEFRKSYGKKRSVLNADIRNLPLKDESADQIWLMNVFGGFENIPKRMPDGSLLYSLNVGKIFLELARILNKEGTIHIGELYPPMRGSSRLTESDFSKTGLEKKVYLGKDEIIPALQKLGCNEAFISYLRIDSKDYVPYYIELTKIK